jgi:pimeloyl-ACP methyl ester carboxylesterase
VASYRIDRLAADVAGVIRAVAPPGTGRVSLCGHDWGGVLAWHVAALYPQLLDRLAVLCAPHPACYRANMDWDQMKRWSLPGT